MHVQWLSAPPWLQYQKYVEQPEIVHVCAFVGIYATALEKTGLRNNWYCIES